MAVKVLHFSSMTDAFKHAITLNITPPLPNRPIDGPTHDKLRCAAGSALVRTNQISKRWRRGANATGSAGTTRLIQLIGGATGSRRHLKISAEP